ncbi:MULTISPECIES: M20 metallopeptidase family protein [Calditerrivibrio]|uniref:M20 metallopeptidase family protein n=1 Tax=Calditerrivibrio TaxID=545865 RepID=UPI003C740E2F
MTLIDQYDLKTFEDISSLAEPSMKEFKTTDYIETFLKKYGITTYKRLSTGLFGDIDQKSNKTIAIRADIDALPCGDGSCKHLCGHNLHSTALLTVLRQISEGKIKPKQNLRFIFQPAEEIISGAKMVIKHGGMRGVDEIYALHVDPDTEFGIAGIKNGAVMAGSTHFKISISGKGTHAAYPHKGNDIVVAISSFIMNSQTIVSRKINPIIPSVLSFGKVSCGTAANILPDKAEILGTFRYICDDTKKIIADELEKNLSSMKCNFDVDYNLEISDGTFPVVNDRNLIDKTIQIFQKSSIDFTTDTNLSMGGEDFCFYGKIAPSLFIRLGIKKDGVYPLHNPNFFIPEGTLEKAVNIWKVILENE